MLCCALCFAGPDHHRRQDETVIQSSKLFSSTLAHVGFSGLLFNPEEAGNIFVCNVSEL
jgi:hypothetical protein